MLRGAGLQKMAPGPENPVATQQWMPNTAEEREMVLEELEAIVTSYHFRGSKRYPALLRHVVDAALDNRSGDLKERTLGVEVFRRDPGYDTNADPVVRVSAGEVRRRIAQYYHENGISSRVQIELPLGSYLPEFQLRAPEGSDADAAPGQFHSSGKSRRLRRNLMLAAVAAALLLGCGIFAYLYFSASESDARAVKNFWNPLFNSTKSVLIVLGTTHPTNMPPPSQETSFVDHVTNPYHHVSVSVALALAHLTAVMESSRKSYDVKESQETTLTDIRSRPAVLVGAYNNDWTLRLVAPLRFHFSVEKNGVQGIQDAANPAGTDWTLDKYKPYLSIVTDYAIVARFRDSTTEGPVVVIAGLGPYGTEAASEFVESPRYLQQLATKLPRGWENRNLELVIKTDVIGVKAGPPVLLSAYTW
jgi:hypothetical protein